MSNLNQLAALLVGVFFAATGTALIGSIVYVFMAAADFSLMLNAAIAFGVSLVAVQLNSIRSALSSRAA